MIGQSSFVSPGRANAPIPVGSQGVAWRWLRGPEPPCFALSPIPTWLEIVALGILAGSMTWRRADPWRRGATIAGLHAFCLAMGCGWLAAARLAPWPRHAASGFGCLSPSTLPSYEG